MFSGNTQYLSKTAYMEGKKSPSLVSLGVHDSQACRSVNLQRGGICEFGVLLHSFGYP